ncbi:MAG TPA: serine hydrolase [Paludibacter sp.]|nr:serine hydrolase [Paludibacter sp.]
MKRKLIVLLILSGFVSVYSQTLYYPPLSSQATWETVSPVSLGWSMNKIDTLYNFLEKENTKAFIVLKDGKIVLEKYFGAFTADSIWYWASAGKTITSFLIGTAQEAGYLSVADPTNKYLGAGWTSCSVAQENAITIRHQLTMTSGLDDGVTDNHCTSPACLKYLAEPGTRWAYHNAPYTLLENVLENATSTNINLYTQSKLKAKTGITGIWAMLDYDNVYFSTARSMARYGLLAQNNFIWKTDTLLHDTDYVRAMTTTSQGLNKSYGYLWWLNGKQSYMLPTLQYIFQGSYAPEAPADMFAGLGKNGQIVSVSPSQGLVVVRMGNQPGSTAADITPQFCNEIWEKLNDVIYNRTAINEVASSMNETKIYPNHTGDSMTLEFDGPCERLVVFDMLAKPVKIFLFPQSPLNIEVGSLPKGVYLVQLKSGLRLKKMFFIRK